MRSCFTVLVLVALQTAGLPPQVTPRVTADLVGYSEGIVFDAEGAAFVSTLHREAVYVIRGRDAPTIWYRVNEPNGHKILPDKTHLVAAKGGIHHVTREGKRIEVLGQQLATPNDLALDGDAGIYVSAPAEREPDQQARRSGIYYLDSKRSLHKVADDFCYPNGIVVRPDGRALLVNDSCTRQIYEFQITAPGILAGKRVVAELSDTKAVTDGMTFDQDGQLYVADYGTGFVVVFDAGGRLLRRYSTGMQHPSNVAFGGAKLGDLYVTGAPISEDGAGQLVVLPLGVRGRSSLVLLASVARR